MKWNETRLKETFIHLVWDNFTFLQLPISTFLSVYSMLSDWVTIFLLMTTLKKLQNLRNSSKNTKCRLKVELL